jgi:hypothetical protein
MKISSLFKKNLAKGEVTMEMLGMATYCYNKRAKNMRDNERMWRDYYRKHRYYVDKYGTVDKYKGIKEEYYGKKDECLAFVKPTALHIVERERTERDWYGICEEYDYETFTFNEYYMLYTIGSYSFHHPITEEEFKKMKDTLPVEEIGDLVTEGDDIENLMSVQTADRIRNGLKSGEYKLVA